ncbi:MAG: DUF4194 domain-containing protein [Blastocatellales bacterium]
MSLVTFAQEYNQLSPGEQTQFAEAIRRLLADGLIWREEEAERRVYHFIARRLTLVRDYLRVAGWDLRHDERIGVFQVTHGEGAHRRRLNRDTTIWLLLLRMIYAEKRERLEITLTRHPVATISEVIQRYSDFFPGQTPRKKSSLDEALRTLSGLKLIRAAGGGAPNVNNPEQMIELLPTLEVVVPASEVAAVAERLREYDRSVKEE